MSTLQRSLFDRLDSSHWISNERYFSAYCPFESHEKPALLVYSDGFLCMSCGKSGDLNYLEKYINIGIISTKSKSSSNKILPRWKKWGERYGTIPEIAERAHMSALTNNLMGYFKARKIDKFFKAGMFGVLDGWYTFPVFNQDHKIIDLVVRAGKGKKDAGAKYVISPQEQGTIRPLYVPNWERVIKADTIYVVYGIITAWALEAVNLPVVTGITGKSLSGDLLQDFQKNIIVIPDYNEEKEGAKLVNSLGWRGKLKLLDYPIDCTDADDIRRFHGETKLMEYIK